MNTEQSPHVSDHRTEHEPNLKDHFLSHTLHFLSGVYIFFTLATITAFILYILGNFQAFTEASQIMLLSISQIMGIIAAIVCLYYIMFLLYWGITRKQMSLYRIINAMFMLILNGGFAVLAIFIREFTQGTSS